MNDPIPPLSEEELNALITDTESSYMVSAPPGLEERVRQQAEAREHAAAHSPRRRRLSPAEELRRFRLQVAASVAAAILFLFAVPCWDALFPQEAGRKDRPAAQDTLLPFSGGQEPLQNNYYDVNGGRP